jgi:hypothetical protein
MLSLSLTLTCTYHVPSLGRTPDLQDVLPEPTSPEFQPFALPGELPM